jgi:hypothetical protein
MLAGTGLSDHARLAHPSSEKHLPKGVVDLVSAGVEEVLALEIHLRAAKGASEALGEVEGSRAAGEGGEKRIQLPPKGGVSAGSAKLGLKLAEGLDEGLGGVNPPVGPEVPPRIRFALIGNARTHG